MKKAHLFYVINFLAAFLLFQIELIIAKILLPKFGGSYLVWGASVVFFQCILLLGYFYSHLVMSRFGMARYRVAQVILMLLPLLVFPGRQIPQIHIHSGIPFVLDVFLQLSANIGLVFFVLSTMSVITQSWWASSTLPQRSNPYILYAISNAGSFLALLSYPFFFESAFGVTFQLNIWRILYAALFITYVISFMSVPCQKTPLTREPLFDFSSLSRKFVFRDSSRTKLTWFALSCAASILFLSVTNIITYDVLPCPLFWMIPLGIYLLSFVLTFTERPYYPAWIKNNIPLILGLSAVLYFLALRKDLPLLFYPALYLVSLFALSVFCQYELYATRPNEPQRLTGFYLTIAFGGVIGSVLVTWIAPIIFVSPIEYLVGLMVVAASLALKNRTFTFKIHQARWLGYFILLLIVWPVVFKRYNVFGLILLYLMCRAIYRKIGDKPPLVCLSLILCACLASFPVTPWGDTGKKIYALRNYYGIYSVTEKEDVVSFYHGSILHGAQFLEKDKENEPLIYFHRHSPVGEVMNGTEFDFRRVGIVGLGIGTLAAYGHKGEEMDFFELDPDVYKIANLCFTYLKNSAASLRYRIGDARINLAKAPEDYYDLIVLDAFSGDAVPVHLLTQEALKEYKRHLTKDGILLMNLGNNYVYLARVVSRIAQELGVNALVKMSLTTGILYPATLWVAITWDKGKEDILISTLKWKKIELSATGKKLRPWTDEYSSIATVFNIQWILDGVRTFTPFNW